MKTSIAGKTKPQKLRKRLLAAILDPAVILQAQGLTPDPWQRGLALSQAPRIMLNCSRGAGKSRITSALALHAALKNSKSLVLLVSRSQRQASELLRYCLQGFRALGRPIRVAKESEHHLEFVSGGRIVSLPAKEETIRGFQGVNLLILDEAARVPDDLYASVAPMVGVSRGRTICLSTPFGPRGFFWREWHDDRAPWQRVRVPWTACPRLGAEFIAEERRKFGDQWIAQEYECAFTARQGLVYPEFDQCRVDQLPPLPCPARLVGGIDFGFRNPFAALWGHVDRDDVLWIHAERYRTQTPLGEHATALPRGFSWYADPAGANDIAELRAAGHKVKPGKNDLRVGIAAVTARLRTGRLKVLASACPNLLHEAKLYRYADDELAGETPIDADNHALAALRYLIASFDEHYQARPRPATPTPQPYRSTNEPPHVWQRIV